MRTRDKIIAKINSIDDEKLLEEIMKLINIESDLDEIYPVSAEQNVAIQEGLKDIKEGRVYSQNEADELIQQWLKKK